MKLYSRVHKALEFFGTMIDKHEHHSFQMQKKQKTNKKKKTCDAFLYNLQTFERLKILRRSFTLIKKSKSESVLCQQIISRYALFYHKDVLIDYRRNHKYFLSSKI